MNEYDSKRIYDVVKKIGYIKTEKPDEANCYIINTCHIREKATDKVYHDVGRLKKEFKNKKKPIVVIAGCVAQAEGEIILQREKYVDAIIGPQSYHEFNKTILKIEFKSQMDVHYCENCKYVNLPCKISRDIFFLIISRFSIINILATQNVVHDFFSLVKNVVR